MLAAKTYLFARLLRRRLVKQIAEGFA